MYIFAENAPVKRHNDKRLKHIPGQLITILAKDEVPKNSKIFRMKMKINENAILEYKRLQENRFDTIDTDYVDCVMS